MLGGAEVLMARMCGLLRDAGWDVRTFTAADLPDPRPTAFRYIHNRIARHPCEKLSPTGNRKLCTCTTITIYCRRRFCRSWTTTKGSLARIVMTAHDYHLICPNSGGNWFRNGPQLADVDRLRSWRYLLTRRWDHRSGAHSLLKLMQHLWHYRIHDRRHTIDLLICTCRFLQQLVARLGIPAAHIPNPNPPGTIRSAPRSGELTFAFAGRIEPEKGLKRFLEALPDDFSARLIIVGDGASRPACEAIASERKFAGQVQFLGRRSHEETVAVIAAAHVVVVPSLLFETYPLVAQEALTVGTNVLVADYGGMREIVLDAEIGYRFHPDQPATLAEQLRAIRAAYNAGTLNAFDPRHFLEERTEARFLDRLLQAYSGAAA